MERGETGETGETLETGEAKETGERGNKRGRVNKGGRERQGRPWRHSLVPTLSCAPARKMVWYTKSNSWASSCNVQETNRRAAVLRDWQLLHSARLHIHVCTSIGGETVRRRALVSLAHS